MSEYVQLISLSPKWILFGFWLLVICVCYQFLQLWSRPNSQPNIAGKIKDYFYTYESPGNHPCLKWSTTGLITSAVGGRIGNIMGQYASALSLAKMKGSKLVVTNSMKNSLQQFQNVTSRLLVEDLDAKCIRSFRNVNLWKRPRNIHTVGSPNIRLVSYPFEIEWFKHVEDQLRNKEFVFTKNITRDVHYFFDLIAVSTKGSDGYIGSKKIYIGIHVRRTDYTKHLAKMYGAKLIDASFYTNAARRMHQLIAEKNPDLNMKTVHLAFVVVTDDPEWCHTFLVNIPQQFSSLSYDGQFSLHFSSDHHPKVDKKRHIFFDLAVLSYCNHSIYDYGTFGFWGAYLANGITILADIGRQYQYNKKIREANLTDWHLLKCNLRDVTV